MSYAENALPAVLPQATQTDDLAKALGVTPQQNANLMEFLRTGDTGKTANSLLISRYLQAFNEGRTGETLEEAAGQNSAQAQGAALGAAGVRQDADVSAALSGQRTGELAEGVGNAGKIPWDNWQNYEKVTANGQEYAKVGNRLYSKHAVDRMQPSGKRFTVGDAIVQVGGVSGRSVAPQFVEDVIKSVEPVFQPATGNYVYTSGAVKIVTNEYGYVVTIMTVGR